MHTRFLLGFLLLAGVARLSAETPQAYILYTGALQGQLEPCG